jgi:hypothetical protein
MDRSRMGISVFIRARIRRIRKTLVTGKRALSPRASLRRRLRAPLRRCIARSVISKAQREGLDALLSRRAVGITPAASP